MRYVKLFENMFWGNPLGDKAVSILSKDVGNKILKEIEIKVDDNTYYTKVFDDEQTWAHRDPYYYHTFEKFSELREYLIFRYLMKVNKGEENLFNFLKESSLSFVEMDGGILFRQSCRFGYVRIVKSLLKKGFRVKEMIGAGIGAASRSNHLEVLDLLISDNRGKQSLSIGDMQKYMAKLGKVAPISDLDRLFSYIRNRINKTDVVCIDYYKLGISEYLTRFGNECIELSTPLHEILYKNPEIFDGKEVIISTDFDNYDREFMKNLLNTLKNRTNKPLRHLTIISKSKPTEIEGVYVFDQIKLKGYHVTSYWGSC